MTDLDEDNFYDENYRFNVEDEEIEDIEYPDEDIEDSADEDIDCDDRYVLFPLFYFVIITIVCILRIVSAIYIL